MNLWQHVQVLSTIAGLIPLVASGRTLEAGSGKEFEGPEAVPWRELQPGDEVRIFHRPEPYRVKWQISASGTAEKPIRILGVPGPRGERPVISGENAISAGYHAGEDRAVIEVGPAVEGAVPSHIEIANLEIRDARPGIRFTDGKKRPGEYRKNAAALYVKRGAQVVIRNCVLRNAGNGLMVSSTGGTPSSGILVERCEIGGNGNPGSTQEHNIYTAAVGITFQFNRLLPLLPGAQGNNLKDRSAGTVIRYNWIEGGNRQLDLVDGNDNPAITGNPAYGHDFVYGNVLFEPGEDGNRQIVHFGGDGVDPALYRKGPLQFYHNTIVSRRPGRTAWFRFATPEQVCDARNNIVAAAGPLAFADTSGVVRLSGNWLPQRAQSTFEGAKVVIEEAGPNQRGADPGLGNDFRPKGVSPCAGTAGPLTEAARMMPPEWEYSAGAEARRSESKPSVGAFQAGN